MVSKKVYKHVQIYFIVTVILSLKVLSSDLSYFVPICEYKC